jgi:glycosyltransferase involved in cell wall biosynthesis
MTEYRIISGVFVTYNHIMNVNSTSLSQYDLICFSHLRWDFVYQRPQHLLSRFARDHRVFVIEEPVFGETDVSLRISKRGENLNIVVPHLPQQMSERSIRDLQRTLLADLLVDQGISRFITWYYTPMMLAWSDHLRPLATVYDCMDELTGFKNAPAELREREAELFSISDLVFTGGQSLYEAKKEQHPAVYAFPSSIDKMHFSRALYINAEMPDQENIPSPRIGFIGVIDERMDIELLGKIADLKPEWNFVMIGPVVKIDVADLPRKENIHYLGGKSYEELPGYIAGWDVAMMPFALNESTRYISPTKTPEYLAAGRPVVSTPIHDVVRPYGEEGLVHIAATAEDFVAAIQKALEEDATDRRNRVDEFLSEMSWDNTFRSMSELINEVLSKHRTENATIEI